VVNLILELVKLLDLGFSWAMFVKVWVRKLQFFEGRNSIFLVFLMCLIGFFSE
jgi:hypothetical protein